MQNVFEIVQHFHITLHKILKIFTKRCVITLSINKYFLHRSLALLFRLQFHVSIYMKLAFLGKT